MSILCDSSKKSNRLLDTLSNFLSNCLLYFHIAFILGKRYESIYGHVSIRSIFLLSFRSASGMDLDGGTVFLVK